MLITCPELGLGCCRLEAVLYSLTAATRELLHLRQPCLPDLQVACAWASEACSKPRKSAAQQPPPELEEAAPQQ